MSRVEPRILSHSHTQSGHEINGQNKIDNVAGASRSIAVTRVRKKPARESRELPGKLRKLSGSKEVLASDLTPLRGRKKEQMIGDLARIVAKIEEFEKNDPEDQVAMLCKVMLSEQMRRLSLINGTQVESNNLGGEV